MATRRVLSGRLFPLEMKLHEIGEKLIDPALGVRTHERRHHPSRTFHRLVTGFDTVQWLIAHAMAPQTLSREEATQIGQVLLDRSSTFTLVSKGGAFMDEPSCVCQIIREERYFSEADMRDAYLRDGDELARKITSVRDHDIPSHSQDLAKSISDFGKLGWIVGDAVLRMAGNKGVLRRMVEILRRTYNGTRKQLPLSALSTLSIICRNHSLNQTLAGSYGLVPLLTDILLDPTEEICNWAAHCLFFLLFNHQKNQDIALRLHSLQNRLEHVSDSERWVNWTRNDAKEVLALLDMDLTDILP